jgi:hypothetical protein
MCKSGRRLRSNERNQGQVSLIASDYSSACFELSAKYDRQVEKAVSAVSGMWCYRVKTTEVCFSQNLTHMSRLCRQIVDCFPTCRVPKHGRFHDAIAKLLKAAGSMRK